MRRLLAFVCFCGLLAGCSAPLSLVPGGAPSPTTAANPGAVKGLVSVTANPPNLPVTSGSATAPAGWKTFASNVLGVALDYPADWTVNEQADGVTFTSPRGQTIQLKAVQPGSGSVQQCSLLINSRGLHLNACVDSSRQTYSAEFSPEGNPQHELDLSTTGSGALDVYRQMLDSVRAIE